LRPGNAYPDEAHLIYTSQQGGGLYDPEGLMHWDGLSIAPGETITVPTNPNAVFVVKVPRSGTNRQEYILEGAFQESGQSFSLTGEVVAARAALTHIDFSCADPGYPCKDPEPGPNYPDSVGGLRAAMFWAMYHESRAGTELSNSGFVTPVAANGQPVPSTVCFLTGAEAGFSDPEIVRILYKDAPEMDVFCQDSRYLSAQTMINGYLNYERSEGPTSIFGYMRTNFRRSMNNEFPAECDNADWRAANPDQCLQYDPNTKGNVMWAYRGCWLKGESYKEVLDGGNQLEILQWLDHYWGCRIYFADLNSDNAWDNHLETIWKVFF
jgi:hypothetical protein